jgi:hypothetical protein
MFKRGPSIAVITLLVEFLAIAPGAMSATLRCAVVLDQTGSMQRLQAPAISVAELTALARTCLASG